MPLLGSTASKGAVECPVTVSWPYSRSWPHAGTGEGQVRSNSARAKLGRRMVAPWRSSCQEAACRGYRHAAIKRHSTMPPVSGRSTSRPPETRRSRAYEAAIHGRSCKATSRERGMWARDVYGRSRRIRSRSPRQVTRSQSFGPCPLPSRTALPWRPLSTSGGSC